MKKRVGLVGYFGWGNFGDELFLSAHKEFLEDTFELEPVHDLFEEPYFSKPIEEVVDQFDAFLIGGGDLLNPVRVSSLYWRKEYLQKPVFVFGIGVPNRKWSRAGVTRTYQEFFQHPNCRLVVARDPESAGWIEKNLEPGCPTIWSPDAVCAMSLPLAKPQEKDVFGFVLRSHRSLNSELDPVKKLLAGARDMGYRVKHLVLGNMEIGQRDLEVAKTLADPSDEIFFTESLDEMCSEISTCAMLATIKFHGMVVATMYGVPAIALSVTPKNANFLRMLERPEMLVSYTDERSVDRVVRYPGRIHSSIRYRLRRDARAGYQKLKEAMEAAV